jgi:hypothetical protein
MYYRHLPINVLLTVENGPRTDHGAIKILELQALYRRICIRLRLRHTCVWRLYNS